MKKDEYMSALKKKKKINPIHRRNLTDTIDIFIFAKLLYVPLIR